MKTGFLVAWRLAVLYLLALHLMHWNGPGYRITGCIMSDTGTCYPQRALRAWWLP